LQRTPEQQRISPGARRRLIWLAALLPFVAVLFFGVYFATALPGCDSCHDQALLDATKASTHAQVACADCHVASGTADRLSFGFRQLLHMELRIVGEGGRDWAAVPDPRCLACHEEVQEAVVNANGLNVLHSECAVGSQCTDCHSSVAHGESLSWTRVYDMETCLECHVSDAETSCDLCHEGQPKSDRITSGVFAITHGADWQKTHGMGNASTCTVCHTAANCEKCHGPGLPHDSTFIEQHSGFARDPKAQCSSCHEESYCNDCHGLDMPHTSKFTREHAKPAEENEPLCKRCHADEDCVTCHVKHVHPGGAIGTLDNPATGSVGD